jgi:hypothetical protein
MCYPANELDLAVQVPHLTSRRAASGPSEPQQHCGCTSLSRNVSLIATTGLRCQVARGGVTGEHQVG